ncbi:MAG: hypothetical protein AB7O59_16185 [Pirellulales bacterium]
MAKLILSLVLAFTQLCSWGGAPVYLCICGERSVCIDGGPQQCNCCEDQHESATVAGACTKGECADHAHEHAAIAAPGSVSNVHELAGANADHGAAALTTPCDCDHVQLSSATRAPALTRGAWEADHGQFITPPVAAHVGLNLVPADADAPRTALLRPPRSTLFTATILSTVVLRC